VSRRVVHYVDSDIFGGSEEAALHLIASLDRARWEPVLMHHPGSGVARLVEGAGHLGVRSVAVPRPIRGGRLRALAGLRQALQAERPAILHVHLSWPLACKYGVLAGWLERVPAIVATAQLYLTTGSAGELRLMTMALRRVIAVSREVRTRYARDVRVPERKLAVVPNGIDVPAIVRQPDPALRAELVRGRPDYVILTPARLHEQKGHADLLVAAAMVPGGTFVLAGDGPLRAELERQAVELNVAERCVFLGYRADVSDLLAAADLFVLPSLFEGLPVSVLEAMAAERPVVATAIGGTDEVVAHEVTGLLVPPRDPAALAAAIRHLQADPALAGRLAAAGRDRVQREFSSAVTAREVMRIYDEVAGPARSAGGSHA
jgi:glycosyltransferase involved in cell wall biosynthesis